MVKSRPYTYNVKLAKDRYKKTKCFYVTNLKKLFANTTYVPFANKLTETMQSAGNHALFFLFPEAIQLTMNGTERCARV